MKYNAKDLVVGSVIGDGFVVICCSKNVVLSSRRQEFVTHMLGSELALYSGHYFGYSGECDKYSHGHDVTGPPVIQGKLSAFKAAVDDFINRSERESANDV